MQEIKIYLLGDSISRILSIWLLKYSKLNISLPYSLPKSPIELKSMNAMNDITVVLVEDHDVVRIGLRAVLAAPGIKTISEATNGVQGLKLLQSTPPDIAIVDIGLPGMDGIEMTRQFRAFQAGQ